MSVSLIWKPGWQAAGGVFVDASRLWAGNQINEVTAYGTALIPAALTIQQDLGGADTPAEVYLALGYDQRAGVLVEYTSSGGSSASSSVLPAVPNSTPIAFSIPIPAGTYTGASWNVTGTGSTGTANDLCRTAFDGSGGVIVGTHAAGAFTTGPTPVNAGELGDINSAAGGSLLGHYQCFGASETNVTVTLTLTGTGGMAWTTATISQWAVWNGAAWANIASNVAAGVYTWASNHGAYGAGCFRGAFTATTQFIRVSVEDGADINSHIDAQYFNISGTDHLLRDNPVLPGGYFFYAPPVTAKIAIDPTLAAGA